MQWLLRRARRKSVEEFVKHRPDPFLTRNKYSWDFVMVFRVHEEDHKLNQVRPFCSTSDPVLQPIH
jgi:hypothetical protein